MKHITKQFTFLKYLGNNRSIVSLPNYTQIQTIYKVSDSGDSFEFWDSDTDDFFNAFGELISNIHYFIITKNSNPNFVLYEESDSISEQDQQIEKFIQFSSLNLSTRCLFISQRTREPDNNILCTT